MLQELLDLHYQLEDIKYTHQAALCFPIILSLILSFRVFITRKKTMIDFIIGMVMIAGMVLVVFDIYLKEEKILLSDQKFQTEEYKFMRHCFMDNNKLECLESVQEKVYPDVLKEWAYYAAYQKKTLPNENRLCFHLDTENKKCLKYGE